MFEELEKDVELQCPDDNPDLKSDNTVHYIQLNLYLKSLIFNYKAFFYT